MANVLRLLGCCFLSMLFVLELFAWLWGFGINLPLFIVCSIGLVVLLAYTAYDILSIKEDNEFLQDRCKNVERMYKEICAENKKLNNSIQEYERKIGELVDQLNRLEKSTEEG